jgi:uncharacterized protein with PIN domain
MNEQQIAEYRARFEKRYPQQAKSLATASSVEEQIVIQDRLIAEARRHVRQMLSALDLELRSTDLATLLSALDTRHDKDKISQAMASLKSSLAAGDTAEGNVFSLNPATLAIFTNARGNRIEIEIDKFIHGLEWLSTMTDNDAIQVSLSIIGFGAVAVGAVAGVVTLAQLLTLSGTFTVSATVAGVVAASVAVVTAVAAFIALSLLLPIMYLAAKPAVCMVLLINELTGGEDLAGNKLVFGKDHNVHGKPTLLTTPLGGAYVSPMGTYAYGGFFSTEKATMAIIGTQYGFTMNCQYSPDGSTSNTRPLSVAFGVTCPLALGSNKCYCAFGVSAEEAARLVDSNGEQGCSVSNADGVKLTINCNSPSGSVAYFIARVYR